MSAATPHFREPHIVMAHGAGGEASRRLIESVIQPAFANAWLNPLADAAVLDCPGGRLAFTTDSFVVQPLAFPGGSIGELAVYGTVNDLAVVGARPLAMAVAFILEAGLPLSVLQREIDAVAQAARRAGVVVAAGDTKVVEHGQADGMYVTATGIGMVDSRAELRPNRVQPGDQVLLSGPMGNHGMAILLARSQLDLRADIRSDTRPLTELVMALLESVGGGLKWLRDATRGGVATVLNELTGDAELSVALDEASLPVDREVRGACELLGLDPLHVANEGQFVAVVGADCAAAALAALQQTPGGAGACRIGQIRREVYPRVVATNAFGGARVVDRLQGDPLPRIC